jgi:hypothetical protein
VHKLTTALAVLVTVGALAASARELDEGTVTDDGTGYHPAKWALVHTRLFKPFHSRVYFKLSNTGSETITLNHVRVRPALPEDDGVASGGQGSLGTNCSELVMVPESPLRTLIVEGSVSIGNDPIQLGIDLAPCESILIEADGADIGVDHVIRLGIDDQYEHAPEAIFLEIWDGECDD